MNALAVPAPPEVQAETTESQPPTATPVEAVLAALANPKYEWRTIEGMTRETHLPPEQIGSILNTDLRDVVIRASATDKRGRALYTTRTRYKKTRGITSRILSALSDQVR